ncbi:HLH transcription regulator [Rhodotorula toruloides]|uniref:HLH transcription regulator n=1 Tax=Rhodotorula toruloides TaxID=5286 RepID=A0A511KGF0_RHOTO|nr:HLH transcription regulator [Rhodotorula toruloides]
MATQTSKHEQREQAWQPPTPRSAFVPLPATTLPVDHLVLLPPPLIPHHEANTTSEGTTAGLLRPTLPSLRATFDSPPASTDVSASRQIDDDDWLPSSSTGKRPRRSAAIAAARNLPRQPSPFDLEEDDPSVEEPSPSASPPPTASSSRAAGTAGSSKRKVSHSLIERRRREKINQCLQALRETVPSLKEEGERKMARARERGRKRGRGDEAGERGGLHKLEILEGTIAYIEDLRSRIEVLENGLKGSSTTAARSTSWQHPVSQPSQPATALPPAQLMPLPSPLLTATSSGSSGSGEVDIVDDHEASMLLLDFATSPELRPVM